MSATGELRVLAVPSVGLLDWQCGSDAETNGDESPEQCHSLADWRDDPIGVPAVRQAVDYHGALGYRHERTGCSNNDFLDRGFRYRAHRDYQVVHRRLRGQLVVTAGQQDAVHDVGQILEVGRAPRHRPKPVRDFRPRNIVKIPGPGTQADRHVRHYLCGDRSADS